MRRLPLALAAALAALSLGACGFTPMYATPGVTPSMQAIQVHVPHGRLAYLIGESLDDSLGHDRGKPPVYRLDLTVDSRVYDRGLNLDATAAYYEDHVAIGYSLVDIATGRVLKTGTQPVEVTYAATNIPYAGIAAQQDAEQRAADLAAQRITVDLGVFFTSQARQ